MKQNPFQSPLSLLFCQSLSSNWDRRFSEQPFARPPFPWQFPWPECYLRKQALAWDPAWQPHQVQQKLYVVIWDPWGPHYESVKDVCVSGTVILSVIYHLLPWAQFVLEPDLQWDIYSLSIVQYERPARPEYHPIARSGHLNISLLQVLPVPAELMGKNPSLGTPHWPFVPRYSSWSVKKESDRQSNKQGLVTLAWSLSRPPPCRHLSSVRAQSLMYKLILIPASNISRSGSRAHW